MQNGEGKLTTLSYTHLTACIVGALVHLTRNTARRPQPLGVLWQMVPSATSQDTKQTRSKERDGNYQMRIA